MLSCYCTLGVILSGWPLLGRFTAVLCCLYLSIITVTVVFWERFYNPFHSMHASLSFITAAFFCSTALSDTQGSGSYNRKSVFLQGGCEPNQKVRWNKSSLNISVSFQLHAKSPWLNLALPCSYVWVFLCKYVRCCSVNDLILCALSVRLAYFNADVACTSVLQ